jgi:hypothetical protein
LGGERGDPGRGVAMGLRQVHAEEGRDDVGVVCHGVQRFALSPQLVGDAGHDQVVLRGEAV